MSRFLERYQQFINKQNLKILIANFRKMRTETLTVPETTAEQTLAEVLKTTFDDLHIGHDQRDIELCEDIVKQCTEKGYSAFKAATIICEELDIEMRWNRTSIETALTNNDFLNPNQKLN
jgi:hypothetical protein